MHHKNCNCGCRKPYKDPVSSRTIVISSEGDSAYDIWLKYNPDLDPRNDPESPWTEEYWLENYVKGVHSDKNYIHYQHSPSQYWDISHPLNKKVSVEITDSAGTVIEGLVTINDGSNVVIQFNSPFSGEAILN